MLIEIPPDSKVGFSCLSFARVKYFRSFAHWHNNDRKILAIKMSRFDIKLVVRYIERDPCRRGKDSCCKPANIRLFVFDLLWNELFLLQGLQNDLDNAFRVVPGWIVVQVLRVNINYDSDCHSCKTRQYNMKGRMVKKGSMEWCSTQIRVFDADEDEGASKDVVWELGSCWDLIEGFEC